MDGGRGREWGARADRGLDEAWGGVKDEVSSASEARQPAGKARGSSLRWGESSRKAADSQSAGAVNDEAHVGTTWSRQGSQTPVATPGLRRADRDTGSLGRGKGGGQIWSTIT